MPRCAAQGLEGSEPGALPMGAGGGGGVIAPAAESGAGALGAGAWPLSQALSNAAQASTAEMESIFMDTSCNESAFLRACSKSFHSARKAAKGRNLGARRSSCPAPGQGGQRRVRLFAALPEGLPGKSRVCGVAYPGRARPRRAPARLAACALHPRPLPDNGHHEKTLNTLLTSQPGAKIALVAISIFGSIQAPKGAGRRKSGHMPDARANP